MLADGVKRKEKRPISTTKENMQGRTPQEVRAEEKGQNDPKKAIPEEVEAKDCRPDFCRRPHPRTPPRTDAEWKVVVKEEKVIGKG